MIDEERNLFQWTMVELKKLAKELEIEDITGLKKNDLLHKIFEMEATQEGLAFVYGCLEVVDDGYGFLRFKKNNYTHGRNDIYVSSSQIKRFGLRKGHMVAGPARAPKDEEKYFALIRVDSINKGDPEEVRDVRYFDKLTPYYPEERLILETDKDNISTRVIDLFTPIGKGQRGLIVAAPRTGKTVLMQNIANAILTNHKEVYVIVLLVDERPEEVTEMRKILIPENSEVVSSTFDEQPRNHIQVAEMAIEKAKKKVEKGHDVVIMLDSITRLARAYNMAQPSSGRVLSGGLDAGSLHRPKKFFGAARNTLEQGSLTIIATALVDTGSRMDQVIFEEFKGTGNMELVLDRSISDLRMYPAVDLVKSGTRREELLLTKEEVQRMFVLRQFLKGMSPLKGIEMLKTKMQATKSNAELLRVMSR
ncbi:MAG: transcription termination factor Rho [Candidatus Cloacimonetes bacterium]|nr:transcription termination factor Rho [Candidatus Cloacimonadota bacterium]MCF7813781.1 transcription termination factor Rho [Candidatus Cloacimonadota bacterium]MCF7868347.1 transcription termination factor Rho [Candidatus Cloacimonadota bacterium]MCF7883821.1 transcription termination factor Rho [Candidatus Cloacimonadota bacterium]